jgi:hypothetical protein
MNPEQELNRKESQTESTVDEVDLGIDKDFREVNEEGEPIVLTRPKPHGLIPIPPEVEAVVAREESRLLKEHGITPTPEARQRMVDSLTLQYYFDGIDIAYRHTPQGVGVPIVTEKKTTILTGMHVQQAEWVTARPGSSSSTTLTPRILAVAVASGVS